MCLSRAPRRIGCRHLRLPRSAPAVAARPRQPLQARLLVIALTWTVLWLSPGPTEAEESSLRERFLKEFPAAHQRLKHAASHAEGEARYLRSTDMANRKVKDRDDMKWGSFRFVTQGDSLRIDQIMPGGGTMTNASVVLTPGFNFRVLSPNSPAAQLVDVSREVDGELMAAHALYWRDYFPACFTFAEADLQEWLERPGFELQSVEAAPEDPELVIVTYQWDGAEWWPNEPPPGRLRARRRVVAVSRRGLGDTESRIPPVLFLCVKWRDRVGPDV